MKLQVLSLFVLLAFATELKYEVGETFHFHFDGAVGSMATAQDKSTSSGNTNHALTSDLDFTVVAQKEEGWLFKMIMTNTKIFKVIDGQRTEVVPTSDIQTPFSEPFFFELSKDGRVEYVAHRVSDDDTSEQFVNVKKGIVATMQTLVDDMPKYRAQTIDSIGVHYTDFSSSEGVISRAYTNSDFNYFPDPAVQPDKVHLMGKGKTTIRDGKIVGAETSQVVTFFSGRKTENGEPGRDDRGKFIFTLQGHGENVLSDYRKGKDVDTIPISIDSYFSDHPELLKDSLVVKVAEHTVSANKNAVAESNEDPFPYHKDMHLEKWIGNTNIGLQLSADAFIGTNFDCQHKHLNYKAMAQAQAKVYLFGDDHNLLLGKFIYGQQDGRYLEDEVRVVLWNDVIYQQSIPHLPECERHNQNLFDKKAGFEVEKTVYIAIIPITFKATASAALKVDWDWSVCPADVTANVDIVPKATVSIGGGVDTSLLIIRGGVELSASFNQALRPEAYLKGSECLIGIKLQREAEPILVDFHGWYEWRHCHWFDCNWGDRQTVPFWSWGLPAVTEVLFQQEWKITP